MEDKKQKRQQERLDTRYFPEAPTITYLLPAGFHLLKVSKLLKRETHESVEAKLVSNSRQIFKH